jgi:hypothetical protein
MKIYSAFDKNDKPIIGSCLSVESCITKTIHRINELGFVDTVLKGQKEATFIFKVEEAEEVYTSDGIDYTDGVQILEMEVILRKKEA